MDLYTDTSYGLSKNLTRRYSTSFSMSSRLLDDTIRPHIYAIYGMVRLADEIVDTYRGPDVERYLMDLKRDVHAVLLEDFSLNPIIHAFGATARKYKIDRELIDPFFASMEADLRPQIFSRELYESYIYGSAEVIGLMCLRVFVEGDQRRYVALSDGARALGAAYQKVNFLRDMKADYDELGRTYFPSVDFESFSEEEKRIIVEDIKGDFDISRQSLDELPSKARRGVKASYYYYRELLQRLEEASVEELKSARLRVNDGSKLFILAKAAVGR